MEDYHGEEKIKAITEMLTELLCECYADPEKTPVLQYRDKSKIIEEFWEPEAPKEGIGLENTIEIFRERLLKASVKTWHPMFFNQMFAGASFPAVIGEMAAAMMNPTLATWEMSPVATIIERNTAEWLAHILGMKQGSSGIFLPGGSLGNLFALMVARNQKLGPDVVSRGMLDIDPRPAILCSDTCHYSIDNAANLLGIGTDHVLKIKTNSRCEMLVPDVHAKIDDCRKRGLRPFAMVVTMGITVTGGFDPLEQILPICKENDIHIHVDAAFGGGYALTKNPENRFEGIEEADSVIWDAHKWLHVPLTCTALLVPDARVLKQTFSTNADYLFHPQDQDIHQADDLGHYTPLCGKRFDALRIWFLFKALGENYFRDLAESRMRLTRDVVQLIEDWPHFRLSYDPVSPIMCFRFLPEDLGDTDQAYQDRLHRWVREECKRRGTAYLNITKLKGADHFRMILINPLTTLDHIRGLLETLQSLSQEFIDHHPVLSLSR